MSLVDRDRAFVWHPYTQMKTRPEPLAIDRGDGVYLYTEDGHRVLDGISSWWVNIHGHAHPRLNQALADQAERLEHVIFAGATHRPAVDLAERLVSALPAGLTRIFYSDNGSTAVEVAVKLALQYLEQPGPAGPAANRRDASCVSRRYRRRHVGERRLGVHAAVRAAAVSSRSRRSAVLLSLSARSSARDLPHRLPRATSSRRSKLEAITSPRCSWSRCCRAPAG